MAVKTENNSTSSKNKKKCMFVMRSVLHTGRFVMVVIIYHLHLCVPVVVL